MGNNTRPPGSTTTTREAKAMLSGRSKKGWLARLLPFLGPAFIASVAYMDPGNFATNIQGGAKFGYELLWVILASNLMAMLLQSLSAKLGIASGHNLAEQCRLNIPRPVVLGMWVIGELVAIAADLIVLSTHRKAGMDAFWVHSVAPNVTRRTDIPQLFIPLTE